MSLFWSITFLGEKLTGAKYTDLIRNLCSPIILKLNRILKYRCFIATWQCSAYHPSYITHATVARSVDWVLSQSAVFTRPPSDFYVFGTAQKETLGEVFYVWWRGEAGCARVAIISPRFIYRDIHVPTKSRNTCTACYWDHRIMKYLYTFYKSFRI